MKNAVICFLKYPEPGHVKTRLAEDLGETLAADLYRDLAERVITEVYPLNADYDVLLSVDGTHELALYKEWIGENWPYRIQSEGNLGARMHHAVTTAFDEGYERVLLLGSDCIGMDETFISEAFKSLDQNDFVIGPSTDGGYYLLALKQDHPWLFEHIAWSTEEVLDVTIERIEMRELKLHQLSEKIDIDTIDDLLKFRQELPPEHFLARKIDQLVISQVQTEVDGRELKAGDYRTLNLKDVVVEMDDEQEEDDDVEDFTMMPPPETNEPKGS